MRKLLLLPLILLVAVSAAAQSEAGAEDGVNFRGQVRFPNNQPASFIQLELWSDGETTFRRTVTTDRAGKFHAGAPCMVVKYRVVSRDYLPVEGQIDISIPPCRALIDITLRSLKPLPVGDVPATGSIDARVAGIPTEARKEFDDGARDVTNNDYAQAIPHLKKAVELYPRYAEAYQLLGVAQLQSQHGPEAESSLVKAIEIEDRMPRAQYLLGVMYAMTGRAELAEKPLNRFAELDPENPDAHFELAKVSFALNKFKDAETHARKAVDLKESNKGVYIVLGYALLRQSKPADAKRAFQQFLKSDPKSAMASDINNTIAQIDQRSKMK
jgi:Flp pilus assembly protein TadD